MKIRPIRSEDDYQRAVRRIESLMSAKRDSEDGDELDVWTTLVDAYERENFTVEFPGPIEAVLFRMEQLGLERKDLEPYIGSRARVSEILNKRRSLSLAMIRALHKNLGIPLEVLVGPI